MSQSGRKREGGWGGVDKDTHTQEKVGDKIKKDTPGQRAKEKK